MTCSAPVNCLGMKPPISELGVHSLLSLNLPHSPSGTESCCSLGKICLPHRIWEHKEQNSGFNLHFHSFYWQPRAPLCPYQGLKQLHLEHLGKCPQRQAPLPVATPCHSSLSTLAMPTVGHREGKSGKEGGTCLHWHVGGWQMPAAPIGVAASAGRDAGCRRWTRDEGGCGNSAKVMAKQLLNSGPNLGRQLVFTHPAHMLTCAALIPFTNLYFLILILIFF